MYNDIINELGTNFIEYAVAVNTDRSIPNSTDGLKPVAKRILYGAFDCGFKSDKPHVKCANIVGNVMADWHPHGDSSIYGALVRLSQPWVMRYPLIDFHGSNGNIDGDGPAAYRYTEAKLPKLVEEGMLGGIKKKNVDFVPNYSETKEEPVELPSIFPNLLCNPNAGIGVAIASSWACHNLGEVAQAIYDYINDKEPMLPGPDFPTGGIVINKNDIPAIMKTGHGSVKIRGKYIIEKNNLVFTEIPYGVGTEALMTQIGELCDAGELLGVSDIRNESNKKGFRLVIELDKTANINATLSKLFAKTNLQTSFSYNQVALVDKTPTELNLKDCIKIYVDYNSNCIVREAQFDIKKTSDRLHIIAGLLKALDVIDEIITTIKQSESAAAAKVTLMNKWSFSEEQAKAILDMKLSRLAKLEKVELEKEWDELTDLLVQLQEICDNPIPELRKRLEALVKKYGDARRTELVHIAEDKKEEKEIAHVTPEDVVVVVTEQGYAKRIPKASFRTQRRGGKGIKTQEDNAKWVFKTNTIDNLMIFTSKGKAYNLLVDELPVGTNVAKGSHLSTMINLEADETIMAVSNLYRDSSAKYVVFITKQGIVKKVAISEYTGSKRKTGIIATTFKEGDSLAKVTFAEDEDLILTTNKAYSLRFSLKDLGATSRTAKGVKGINLSEGDYIINALPIKHDTDYLASFTADGMCKKTQLKEFPIQTKGGKGVISHKNNNIISTLLVEDKDEILIIGSTKSICISAKDIPAAGRNTVGVNAIQGDIKSVSKI